MKSLRHILIEQLKFWENKAKEDKERWEEVKVRWRHKGIVRYAGISYLQSFSRCRELKKTLELYEKTKDYRFSAYTH